MKIDELLAYFDNGGSFGDDPEIVSSMRKYIQDQGGIVIGDGTFG